MAGFFPVFFKQYWSVGTEAAVSTFRLGMLSGLGSLVIALAAPLLGAMADRGGARVKLLAFFTLVGAAATGGLYFVGQGDWVGAAVVYSLAGIGFWGGVIFNDALLVDVADPPQYDVVSAFGYSLGYAGGGLLLLLNVAMVTSPARFGLADAARGRAPRIPDGRGLVAAVHAAVPLLGAGGEARAPARAAGRRARRLAGVPRDDRGGAQVPRRSSGSCSPTGCTSTASTRSSRWPWTSACRSASRSRA